MVRVRGLLLRVGLGVRVVRVGLLVLRGCVLLLLLLRMVL